MPKILSRDPAWLSRPTPGFNLFQAEVSPKAHNSAHVRHEGPPRKIAHRGAEVFVAVGNELRWSDLGLMRDAGEDYERTHGRRKTLEGDRQEDERVYRVRIAHAISPQ